VTGLGSPNFQVISILVINNQTAFPNLGAYPNGNSITTSADDDGDQQYRTDVAFGLSIAGAAVACLAFGFAIFLCFGRKNKGEPLLKI
jgi:hypothetical protein